MKPLSYCVSHLWTLVHAGDPLVDREGGARKYLFSGLLNFLNLMNSLPPVEIPLEVKLILFLLLK